LKRHDASKANRRKQQQQQQQQQQQHDDGSAHANDKTNAQQNQNVNAMAAHSQQLAQPAPTLANGAAQAAAGVPPPEGDSGSLPLSVGQNVSNEIEQLKRDRFLLLKEVMRLREQNSRMQGELSRLHERVNQNERMQQDVIGMLHQLQISGSPAPDRLTKRGRLLIEGGNNDESSEQQHNQQQQQQQQHPAHRPHDELQYQFPAQQAFSLDWSDTSSAALLPHGQPIHQPDVGDMPPLSLNGANPSAGSAPSLHHALTNTARSPSPPSEQQQQYHQQEPVRQNQQQQHMQSFATPAALAAMTNGQTSSHQQQQEQPQPQVQNASELQSWGFDTGLEGTSNQLMGSMPVQEQQPPGLTEPSELERVPSWGMLDSDLLASLPSPDTSSSQQKQQMTDNSR
jgi:predicted transcriptional regulator